jgi:hypothetical protein
MLPLRVRVGGPICSRISRPTDHPPRCARAELGCLQAAQRPLAFAEWGPASAGSFSGRGRQDTISRSAPSEPTDRAFGSMIRSDRKAAPKRATADNTNLHAERSRKLLSEKLAAYERFVEQLAPDHPRLASGTGGSRGGPSGRPSLGAEPMARFVLGAPLHHVRPS